MVIFQLSNTVATHVHHCIDRDLAVRDPPNNVDVHGLGATAPTCCSSSRVDEQWLLALRSLGTSSCLLGVSSGMVGTYGYNEVRRNAEN